MSKRIAVFSSLICLLFFISGCGGGSSAQQATQSQPAPSLTKVSVKINGGADLKAGKAAGRFRAAAIPSQIASVALEMRTPDCGAAVAYTSIIDITAGQSLVSFNFSVPSGTTACFTAKAYSQPGGAGTLLYQGTTTGVPLLLNDTISVEINMGVVGTIPPTATTNAAGNITNTTATLNGQVNPNGYETMAYFEYGISTGYGSTTPIKEIGNGSSAVSISQALSGLTPNTTYHYRAVARNSGNTTYGADSSFITSTSSTSGNVTINFSNALPTVTTGSASNVQKMSATLNGTVTPGGSDATAYFEWGKSSSFGQITPLQSPAFGAYSTNMSGLSLQTTYHYRTAAFNADGLSVGDDLSFTTLDGAWGDGGFISSDNIRAYEPKIAVDPSGNAIVVWKQSSSVMASRYAEGAWGQPVIMGNGYRYDVAVDQNGNAIVVWTDSYEGKVMARRYVAGYWEPSKAISDAGGAAPRIAFDLNGNAIAVWYDGSVYACRYVKGTGWGVPVLITNNGYSPRVAFDSGGKAIAVWVADGNIYASRYAAENGWGEPALIGAGASPDIAVDPIGNAVVVWNQGMPTHGNVLIMANRFTLGPGGGWGDPVMLFDCTSNNPDYYGFAADSQQIVMDPSGNAYAIWYVYDPWGDGSTSRVFARMMSSIDGVWSTPVAFENGGYWLGSSNGGPRLAFDSSGNGIALWAQADNSSGTYEKTIWTNRYVTGTGWGGPQSSIQGIGYAPEIGIDSLGKAIAVWTQKDPTQDNNWRIRANRFD